MYVVATGDDCLYMLRFDGAFKLLARGSFQAAQVYFRRHLVVLVLINGEIGRVKIRRIRYSLGFVLALIVLLLAILYRM